MKDGLVKEEKHICKEKFSFDNLESFENLCHYFLFDTKSKSYGGSGEKFDWKINQ